MSARVQAMGSSITTASEHLPIEGGKRGGGGRGARRAPAHHRGYEHLSIICPSSCR